MNMVTKTLEGVGGCVILLARAIAFLPSLPLQLGRLVENCFHIGYRTFPIVALLSFFMGAVLALQTGYSLSGIAGGEELIGGIVGLGMARELGPLMAAFLLAGRMGSSITAEISSMKVYQEVDALRTMGIQPERILVMPRLVAVLIMMPVLTICTVFIGWFGGMTVAQQVGFINLDATTYWNSLRNVTQFRDVFNGLLKAEIFGLVIVLIACQQGLATRGGPREIGLAVTRSVVASMFMVLLLDYVLTHFLMQTVDPF